MLMRCRREMRSARTARYLYSAIWQELAKDLFSGLVAAARFFLTSTKSSCTRGSGGASHVAICDRAGTGAMSKRPLASTPLKPPSARETGVMSRLAEAELRLRFSQNLRKELSKVGESPRCGWIDGSEKD